MTLKLHRQQHYFLLSAPRPIALFPFPIFSLKLSLISRDYNGPNTRIGPDHSLDGQVKWLRSLRKQAQNARQYMYACPAPSIHTHVHTHGTLYI